jgi:adenylosuccinate synthase
VLLNHVPADLSTLAGATPQYEEHPGWRQDTSGARAWVDLPPNARSYIERLCQVIGAPLDMVSVGPHRDQTIIARNPFKTVPQQVGQLVQALERE